MKFLDLSAGELQELVQELEKDCDELESLEPLLILVDVLHDEFLQKINLINYEHF